MGGRSIASSSPQLGAALQFDDAVNIQFTSGTTGSPKGVTLTHHNILNNGYFVGRAMRPDRAGPHLHSGAALSLLRHGDGQPRLRDARRDDGLSRRGLRSARDAARRSSRKSARRSTACRPCSSPSSIIPISRSFDLTSLRTGIMAGAPCPIEVMKRVNSEMNMREVTIAYGMTETSPVSFQSAVDDPLERRVSTVGRIHPHVEVKVVDAEGRIVPRGERGELCTRGYSVMLGYWDEKEKTAEALDADGWMHTGDLATIDDEGYCNIVGRIKDMVIRGGENLYPREIEEFLYRHPKIQDVQIFGVADDPLRRGALRLDPRQAGETLTAEEIRAFCDGQIAHNKIPRYVEFVDEFPMTVTGKIQKFLMRDDGGATAGVESREDGVSSASAHSPRKRGNPVRRGFSVPH